MRNQSINDDIDSIHDTDTAPTSVCPPTKKLSLRKKCRNWTKDDIGTGLPTQHPWPPKQLPKFLLEHQTPSTIFGLFFVLNAIVQHSTVYAKRDKGNHSFETNVDEVGTLIAILLILGYNNVPRCTMYWEQSIDVQNEAIAAAMSLNKCDELMRYLHVSVCLTTSS